MKKSLIAILWLYFPLIFPISAETWTQNDWSGAPDYLGPITAQTNRYYSKDGIDTTSGKIELYNYLLSESGMVMHDDFSTGLGGGWKQIKGSWNVSAGILNGSNLTGEGLIIFGSPKWTDMVVSARIKPGSSGTREAGIAFRYRGPDDFYFAGLGSWGHQFSIGTPNGELAEAGDWNNIDPTKWYDVKINVKADSIKLYVDGKLEVETSTTTYSYGKIGLHVHSNTGEFDEVSVCTAQTIELNNLPSGLEAWLYKYDVVTETGTFIGKIGEAYGTTIDLSERVGRFPFEGYFDIRRSGKPHTFVMRTPIFKMFGGDEYKWEGTKRGWPGNYGELVSAVFDTQQGSPVWDKIEWDGNGVSFKVRSGELLSEATSDS